MLAILKWEVWKEASWNKETFLKKVCPNEDEDNINIDIYFKNLRELLDQLHGIDFEIPNDLVILMEFNFFPNQYNILIKTLTSKENLPSLEELESKLINEEL